MDKVSGTESQSNKSWRRAVAGRLGRRLLRNILFAIVVALILKLILSGRSHGNSGDAPKVHKVVHGPISDR